MRHLARLLLATLLFASVPAVADEGMWTFNHFPKQILKARHGFEMTDAWLDHVRLASVRFNSGGSGSFVSSGGLVMTNHHVGADCIHKLGTSGKDWIAEGFLAKDASAELKCPDLELNVLTAIDDVTAQVKAAEKPGMTPAQANQAQKEQMSTLEKQCATATGLRCDVVTLYHGGIYNLYKYKKFTDVRLVFAPEGQIAFFGGDPDNFTFPRYDFDVAFFRAYDAGKPVQPQHFLQWSGQGAADGDLVFTSGHPGTTSRLNTLAQLEVLRDLQYPTRLADLARVHEVLVRYARTSPEAERQAHTPLFGVENGQKAITGYLKGLQDASAMKVREKAEAEAQKNPDAAKAIADIGKSQAAYRTFFQRYVLTEGNGLQSKLFGLARHLVRLEAEKKLPSEKRLREYRDSNLPSVELAVFSGAPIYPALEEALLADALTHLHKTLGDKDPLVVTALAGQTPAVRAKALIAGSKLADVAERRRLAGDTKALEASQDPLILLAKALDGEARALRKRYEDEVEGPVRQGQSTIARAAFAAHGTERYPDATFTLRLSFGKVAGYKEDNGTQVAPLTTIGGLFARSDKAGGKHPWDLPKRWLDARKTLDPKVPMNAASTNDIIGGNSGSPVVDKKGELVGLIFDGNIQSLAGQFLFDERQNRAVWVASQALLEGLRKVYDAGWLADELQGKRAK
jgi:hypothetical protein